MSKTFYSKLLFIRNNSAHIADHHDRLGENSGDHIRNPTDHH